MGFFDAIRGVFDPYTIKQFDYLYNHYYKALYLYICGGYKHPINKILGSSLTHIYLSKDMSYDNKKFIVEMKDTIISMYNREIAFDKASEIMSKYPIGTTLICYKEFNITISDTPSVAKKALSDHITDSFRFGLWNKNNIDKKWKHQVLTISEVLLYSENIVEKENSIRDEERKLHKQINKWQKEADDKIISDAKYLARFYPNGYKKLVNFPIDTMSLGQAKSTLESESRIKQYEKEYRERENMPSRVKQAVNNWETVKGIPYYFFYYYYPIRISDISSTSDKARKIIWDFKNGYDTDPMVSDLVVEKLKATFLPIDLKQMTFVCIPASTIKANKDRYEKFSKEVCAATGMRNAFSRITIVKEKIPARLSESHQTVPAEYSFNEAFFKKSIVILFDDIVTRGRSMIDFVEKLREMEAVAFCAISIGRTYSDDFGDMIYRKPHPYTGTL